MYYVSRWLLKLAVIMAIYSLLVLSFCFWPISGFCWAIMIVAYVGRRRRQLTTLGSARWADESDFERNGMFKTAHGLILGRYRVWTTKLAAAWALFRFQLTSKEACEQFWSGMRKGQDRIVRLGKVIHTAVFAPSGGGKGVSLIVPFLMECPENIAVIDFKGELASLTAEHRRRVLGHRVVLLDPYGVVTDKSDTFNPLDGIAAGDPLALDLCNALAKALVVRNPEEKEPHWNDCAELWIASMLALVVQYGDSFDQRSLQTIRDFFSSPERIDMAVKLMTESDCWNGMLARLGGQLSHLVDREKSSTLTTVNRQLRFLDTPAIAANTSQSSFDPKELLNGKMTIYLILPPEHMRAQSALLRMWIGCLMRTIVSGGLRNNGNIHFVLDEAASLGHLEIIEDAVDKFRGYGIRLQFYYQSIGQLKQCFPNGQDTTLLSNTSQIYFGVNDVSTAELVSNRLGEETIVVNSGGSTSGSSSQNSGVGPHSTSYSNSSNSGWQQQARKLLKPEEVMALPPRVAITFTPGMPPIFTTLLRYYEEPWLLRRHAWFKYLTSGSAMCVFSVGACYLSFKFAVIITEAASRSSGL